MEYVNEYIVESGAVVNGCPEQVCFRIQSGPIKESGVNGLQIDEVIRWAKEKIERFNRAFPSRENTNVIIKLDEALLWLLKRRLDREARGVEGTKAQ